MEAVASKCSVCKEDIDPAMPRAFDVDFGEVCHSCKINLRWAYAYLNKKETGMRPPTTKEMAKLTRHKHNG